MKYTNLGEHKERKSKKRVLEEDLKLWHKDYLGKHWKENVDTIRKVNKNKVSDQKSVSLIWSSTLHSSPGTCLTGSSLGTGQADVLRNMNTSYSLPFFWHFKSNSFTKEIKHSACSKGKEMNTDSRSLSSCVHWTLLYSSIFFLYWRTKLQNINT